MTTATHITVRGYHLDLYGHVNNARYLEFLEEARWALLEDRFDLAEWREAGRAFYIVNINIDYMMPACLGDELVINTHLLEIGERSAVLRQSIHLGDSDSVITNADITFVIADALTRKAIPLQGELREHLETLLPDDRAARLDPPQDDNNS